jgi:hypothetical protein
MSLDLPTAESPRRIIYMVRNSRLTQEKKRCMVGFEGLEEIEKY